MQQGLKAHGSLSRDWVIYELNAPCASDYISQIQVNTREHEYA